MSTSIERVTRVVEKIDASGLLGANFVVGVCSRTGLPKISCGLIAPDTRTEGLPVQTGVKAGGIGWPPHTVVLASHDESETVIVNAALEAFDKALMHEGREHFKYDGKLFVDPHPRA